MSAESVTLVAFLSAMLSVLGIGSLLADLYLRDRARIKQRMDDHFRGQVKECVQRSALFKESLFRDLQQLASETAVAEPSAWRKLQDMVEQSRLPISASQLLLLSLSMAFVAGGAAYWLTGLWWLALMLSAAGTAAPWYALFSARAKRIRKLCLQLPEAFEIMSRALRAGQTMSAALEIVAREFESPIREEFAYCHEQQNLGLPWDVALRDLARRSGVMELQMFVVALLVHRQAGGNPVEILNNLSMLIRKRLAMEGRVKALTGEGRMQALVLTIMPPLALLAVLLLNRDYGQVLLDRPEVLGAVGLSEIVGAVWIRRITHFDY